MSDVEMNQPAYGEPSSTGAATPAPTIPQRPEPKRPPLWDGKAGERIAEVIVSR